MKLLLLSLFFIESILSPLRAEEDLMPVELIVQTGGRPDFAVKGKVLKSMKITNVEDFDTLVPDKEVDPTDVGAYEIWLDLILVEKSFSGNDRVGSSLPLFYRVYKKLPIGIGEKELDRRGVNGERVKKGKSYLFIVYHNKSAEVKNPAVDCRSTIYIGESTMNNAEKFREIFEK